MTIFWYTFKFFRAQYNFLEHSTNVGTTFASFWCEFYHLMAQLLLPYGQLLPPFCPGFAAFLEVLVVFLVKILEPSTKAWVWGEGHSGHFCSQLSLGDIQV